MILLFSQLATDWEIPIHLGIEELTINSRPLNRDCQQLRYNQIGTMIWNSPRPRPDVLMQLVVGKSLIVEWLR